MEGTISIERQTQGLSPKYVLNKLYDLTQGDILFLQSWAKPGMGTQYYTYTEPRSFISSGGLGTMGYGLGAAIGASLGNPGKKVVNVAGDGSFKMNSNELATLSKYKPSVIQLVFNNHALGMVRQWQELFCNSRFSFTLLGDDVDFVKLGEAYGIKAIRISSNDQVEGALKEALDFEGPVILECVINEENMVLPMVAPGAPIDQIVD